MNAYFDLEGTLLDISERWYQLHRDMATKHQLPILSRDTYVGQKRDGVSERTIYRHHVSDIAKLEAYERDRIAHIEDEKYLTLDVLVPNVHTVLEAWREKYRLRLITKRSDPVACERELNLLGIRSYFESVHIGDKRKSLAAYSTSDLAHAPFISDALEDIELAQELGMHPIVVTYGCRSETYFRSHGVSNYVTSPSDLVMLAYV